MVKDKDLKEYENCLEEAINAYSEVIKSIKSRIYDDKYKDELMLELNKIYEKIYFLCRTAKIRRFDEIQNKFLEDQRELKFKMRAIKPTETKEKEKEEYEEFYKEKKEEKIQKEVKEEVKIEEIKEPLPEFKEPEPLKIEKLKDKEEIFIPSEIDLEFNRIPPLYRRLPEGEEEPPIEYKSVWRRFKDYLKEKKEAEKKRRVGERLEWELPFKSQLSITGRKTIEAAYSVTKYKEKQEGREDVEGDLDIKQQLQVRVQGRIGPPEDDHIDISVNFDDSQENKNRQQISINYVGRERSTRYGDVTYDAQFGDVSMNLGSTEFAMFNKSLFGVLGSVTVRDFDFMGIQADRLFFTAAGTKTKGVSALKEFTGQNEFQEVNIPARNFVSMQYFVLEFDPTKLPISNVNVYLDDRNAATDKTSTLYNFKVQNDTDVYQGNFDILFNGIDFTVDGSDGIIIMQKSIDQDDVIAVSFSRKGGSTVGTDTPLLIKPEILTDYSKYLKYQLRTIYNIGATLINPNNFVLEIRDRNGSDISSLNVPYIQHFGLDKDKDEHIDPEFINYELGIIDFRGIDVNNPLGDTRPFDLTDDADPVVRALSDTEIYDKAFPDINQNQYDFHLEFQSARNTFILGFDIIEGSEIVLVDGVKKQREVDYFIDYDVGLIQFFDPNLIKPTSKVVIHYEYSPFGGIYERTLIGSRTEIDFNSNINLGATLLKDFSSKPDEIPDAFTQPDELSLFDINGSLRPLHLLIDGLNRFREKDFSYKWADFFNISLQGEYAKSIREPNTYGSASVEDFEDIDKDINLSVSEDPYIPAPPPYIPSIGTILPQSNRAGTFGNAYLEVIKDIGHNATLPAGEVQNSLCFRMDFSNATDTQWASIRTQIGRYTQDISDYTSIEFWLGVPAGTDTSNLEIYIELGLIQEDADNDGLDDEDINGDDILNPGEDVGINVGGIVKGMIGGKPNGILDSEDLDNDGSLDSINKYFVYGDLLKTYLNRTVDINFTSVGTIRWFGFLIPIDGDTAEINSPTLTTVKDVRITIYKNTAVNLGQLSVYFDYFSIIGSNFEDDDLKDSVVIFSVNSEKDADYVENNYFRSIHGLEAGVKEQALKISYSLPPSSKGSATRDFSNLGGGFSFSRSMDFSDYRILEFYLYRKVSALPKEPLLHLQFGADNNNYIQYTTDLNNVAFNTWTKETIKLDDVKNILTQRLAGGVISTDTTLSGNYTILGDPSLHTIKQIKIILENQDTAVTITSGELWLNEIVLTDIIKDDGSANKLSFSTQFGKYLSLSGGFRNVGGDFRGVGMINNPVTNTYVNTDQKSKSLSGNTAIENFIPSKWRISLPLNFSWQENESKLEENIETVKRSDLGEVKSINRSLSGGLTVWRLPTVSASYSDNDNSQNYKKDKQKSDNSTLSLSTGYSYTFNKKMFKIIPIGQQLSFNTSCNYNNSDNRTHYYTGSRTNQIEFTKTATENYSYSFQNRVFNWLTYGYSGSQNSEKTISNLTLGYDGLKNRNHNVIFSLDFMKYKGFDPLVNITGGYNESFSRVTGAQYKIKSAGLTGNFDFSLGIYPAELIKFLKFIDIRYSYKRALSASYNNLQGGVSFSSIYKDYIRKRLFPFEESKIEFNTDYISSNRQSASTVITHNYDGNIYTIQPLSISYNVSKITNNLLDLSSESVSDALNYGMSLNLNVGQVWKWLGRKTQSTYLSSRFSFSENENVSSKSKSFTPSLTWNFQWTSNFNTVYNMNYSRSESLSKAPNSVPTIDKKLSPSLRFNYSMDKPFFIKVPLKKKGIEIQNQFTISGGTSGDFTTHKENNKKTTDTRNYNFDLGASYRVRQNINISFSGNGGYYQDKVRSGQDKYTLGFNSRFEWIF
ncbi:MAG: hypothetical protein AB1765_10430 [Candidatus Hydrogenedentota bacterium]